MHEARRVNWVVCPKCKYQYYVGASLIIVNGALAVCPKCRHEFDARANLKLEAKDTRTF